MEKWAGNNFVMRSGKRSGRFFTVFISRFSCFIGLLCIGCWLSAQESIAGTIVSQKGEPLAGANVFIPNTAMGTVSGANGSFVLRRLPAGNFKIAVSHIGYEVYTANISKQERAKPFQIVLAPRISELKSVTIRNYVDKGWSKWGNTFTEAFVGTSSYATKTRILNQDAVRFVYLENLHELHAFADEPVILENRALGYRVSIDLVDFTLDVANNQVDYQIYSFFTPLEGTEDEMAGWKKNRREAYSFSLMHFMRALHANELKEEGFEIRLLERKQNTEKQRINLIYKNEMAALGNQEHSSERAIERRIEKKFPKDSVVYFRKVLSQEDRKEKLHPALLSFKDIAVKTDSNTAILKFTDYLVVTYKRKMEPAEYADFRTFAGQKNMALSDANNEPVKRQHPFTILTLTQDIPLEINETGYFKNVDLMIDGFWGWWEKIGTKLPYDYLPF